MALESNKEKLADLLSRLHQDAKRFSLIGNEQRKGRQTFWANYDSDLAVGFVPAQTFTSGEGGTHLYAAIADGEQWFIGVMAWLRPERSLIEDAQEKDHIVAAIPMTDADHAIATLREIALLVRSKTSSKPQSKSVFAK